MFIDFTWDSGVRVQTAWSPTTLVFGICKVKSGPVRGEIFRDDDLLQPTVTIRSGIGEATHTYMEYRCANLLSDVKFRVFTAVRSDKALWSSRQFEVRVIGSKASRIVPLWLRIQVSGSNFLGDDYKAEPLFGIDLADYDPLSEEKCPSEAVPIASRAVTAWDRIRRDTDESL
jgi:hypothetical protein